LRRASPRQVIGNDAAVAFGGTQGAFELNVYMPMMARNLLESIRLLTNVSTVFRDKCIDGLEADEDQCLFYAESSPSIGTSLNPYIGYEKAGEVIKRSMKENRTIREIVLEEGLMSEAEVDKALDVMAMTKGGII
jgi:fumarate hydratase class II